jgi:hypothetical protein
MSSNALIEGFFALKRTLVDWPPHALSIAIQSDLHRQLQWCLQRVSLTVYMRRMIGYFVKTHLQASFHIHL